MLKTLDATLHETLTPVATTPIVPEAPVPAPVLESTLARIVADALQHPFRYIEQTIVDAEGE